jgi:uncharacterized membrane protein
MRRYVLRNLQARPRLFLSVAIGVIAALLMPAGLGRALRLVISWDCGAATFLVLVIAMAAGATPESMRRRAAPEDEAGWVFLALVGSAAFFSMFAVLGLMRDAKAAGGPMSVAPALIAGITILLSWLFTHAVFAVHYAHNYFSRPGANGKPPLDFPGEESDPDYWDFLYFSFVVGMTAQVSDVQVTTQYWRRLVLAHGLLSFLFNTVVLALSINLLAGFF